MCRNIKVLFNFEPPATEDEMQAAALQYVRKISGYNKPSKSNEKAFNLAVKEVFKVTQNLINALETKAPTKNREMEAAKAKAKAVKRFG